MTSESKRVVIFSGSFGGGCAAAARAMEAYFEERHAGTVDVVVTDFLEEFVPSLGVLAKFAYQQAEEFFPSLTGDYQALLAPATQNPVVADLKQSGLTSIERYLSAQAPDAVISTFPLAGGLTTEVLRGSDVACATTVLDYDPRRGWFDPTSGTYFVTCREARERLAVRGVPWEHIAESGAPIRAEFADRPSAKAARAEHGLADRFTVLLMATSGTPTDVADLAGRLVATGVQVAAVTGENERVRERLDKEASSSNLLKVFGFVQGMHTMMAASDVLVSRVGGLSIPEAVAARLPIVMYGLVPGQEVHNADFLVSYGVAMPTRDEGDVVDKVGFLSTHDARLEQMAASAGLLGRPDSAQTVCERVLAAVR